MIIVVHNGEIESAVIAGLLGIALGLLIRKFIDLAGIIALIIGLLLLIGAVSPSTIEGWLAAAGHQAQLAEGSVSWIQDLVINFLTQSKLNLASFLMGLGGALLYWRH